MTTKSFSGFPAGVEITPIPNLFLTTVLPRIEDINELKTVLHMFWLLSNSRRYPRFTTYNELLSDSILINGIKQSSKSPDETLRQALDLAVKHGIILHLRFVRDATSEDAYFINTESDRKAIAKIQDGELVLPDFTPEKQEVLESAPPDIFNLYEQNIGMLTPIIAEELQEAEKLYPADWIESAFKEAVALNKRNWKYISRILERWTIEGKDNGKLGRDSKEKGDSSKYIKGKYGHMVKR